VLARAAADQRAVVTLNRRDFIRLHEQGAAHAGVVVCTADNNFQALATRIHQRIEAEQTLNGQLIAIQRA
jgi:hypothetical protein